MTRAVQHSAKSVEHYGPDYMGAMVRDVFGCDITLDPASCSQANTLIGALAWFGPEWAALGHPEWSNGLACPWGGSVYLNPPGGRVDAPGLPRKVNSAALWFAHLAERFAVGEVDQAMFMVFNLELARYTQAWKIRQPFAFPHVIPRERIDFWKPGPSGDPVPQGQPGHPNALIYMGPHVERFRDVCSNPRPGTDWAGGHFYKGE